jgi:soluble lytic murein transglycosylase-like protein
MKNRILIIVIVLAFFFFGGSVEFDPLFYITPPVTVPPYNFVFTANVEKTLEVHLPPMREIPVEHRAIIDAAIKETGVPIEIIAAILHRESQFLPTAKSPIRENGHRDMGICQFNSQFIDWFSDHYNGGVIFDPMNPAEAIPIMARHIKWLYERYGGYWPDVIMAYNAGIVRIDSGDIPDSAWDYLIKIYE